MFHGKQFTFGWQTDNEIVIIRFYESDRLIDVAEKDLIQLRVTLSRKAGKCRRARI